MKNNVNLNLYKTFYDVARYKSFSKAASFTYSTQPAISKSIKKLESDLDVQLFVRKPNGVELTDKGRELLYYIEKAYGNLITAERILTEKENLNRGSISIGVPSNLAQFYLLDKIIAFRKKYPNIDVTILTGSTSYLLSKLELHKIDFIIDTAPIIVADNNIIVEELFDLKYCFVTNKNDKKKYTSIKDFENENLILPIPGTQNRNDLDVLFATNNVQPTKILNIHTSELIASIVGRGEGIGYVLENMIPDNIKKIKIKEETPKTKVLLVYSKKFLTSAPKKFIKDYMN